MATRGIAHTVQFVAWDSGTNAGKTGDGANFTMRWVKDGTSAALTTTTVTEIDSTNCPGLYKVGISATEADCNIGTLAGKSSTSGISIVPVTIQFERLPDAAPAAAGGVLDTTRIGGQTASASGTVTFPNATLASTTNITAGTITTVTNLTNAPTSGDLTATMKASVTTAATASTPTVTVSTNNDKTGYSISGTTTTLDALQTAQNAAHGSGSWATATGFSTHSAADVWAVGTRTLSGTIGSFDSLWTKIKNWLGALAGKTADTITRAEINATTAGASFNETTDSLQAIRDRGDAEWITGTGGGDGSTVVVVSPISSTVASRVSASSIECYSDETGFAIGPVVVTDSAGDAVDLTQYTTLRLTIEDKSGIDLLTTTDVTVSGVDNNQWTATGTDAITATAPAKLNWSLRGISTGINVVLGRGTVQVTYAASQDG